MCIIPKFVSNDVVAKLSQAKQLVEDGWCQHLFAIPEDDERFNYCTVGAMCSTTFDKGETFDKMVNTFIKANNLPPSDYVMGKMTSITIWNDAPERTKEEVLAAFDKAIAYAE